jgi:dienelactone hydrolase
MSCFHTFDMSKYFALGIATLFLIGCGDEGPTHVELTWDPGGGELSVFPDDAFTVEDSASRTGLRPSIDPLDFEILATAPETFQEIFRDLSTLDGFGLTAGIFFRFDAALDPTSVESGESTAALTAPVVVMVETSAGPTPWPYEARLTDEDMTLIVEPMIPFPPKTRVYVAVTTRLSSVSGLPLAPSPAMAAALAGDSIDDATARVATRIADSATAFVAAGGAASIDELAGVSVFTTQSIYEDAIAIADHIATRDISPNAITCTTEELWIACEGTFDAIDYRGADGFIEDVTEVDATTTYEVPFTAWLPLVSPGPYGGDAFPTLIYGHGLGGGRDQGERLAEFAAPRGMATVAIDALMHGDHPTAESNAPLTRILDFFGISTQDLSFRPLLMREHFRGSTYDKVQLVRMLQQGVDVDGDQEVDLDPARVSYLGVSLGGIMGPEMLALTPSVDAAVLVVPGGRVSSIVSDAEQFGIIIELMKPDDTTDGDVDRFFPVLQTMLERGDAAVWAPYLLGEDLPTSMPGSTPHILMGMVLDDDTVPNTTNRALARALNIPLVPPMRQEVGIIDTTAAAPVSANLGDGRTAGLLQFDVVEDGDGGTKPATHSNVGDSDVGAEAWFHFLDSYLTQGTPEIIDPYEQLGIE